MVVLQALWLILPAYAANAFPVVIKGKRPLDFRRKLVKHRILGDGKTIEGTLAGIVFGIVVGLLQIYIQPGLNLQILTMPLVVLLSAGAITGDIIGAFIKRRLGIPRGKPALLLDQLDFVAGALLFSSMVYRHDLWVVLTLLLLTPPIHYATNVLGHMLKFKRTPW